VKDLALGEQVAAELARAARARQAGASGQARVGARRAAGWALGGDPAARASSLEGTTRNAYRALQSASVDGALPASVRSAAARLTARVDKEFNLPFDNDPIEDAWEIVCWRWPGWQPSRE